MKADDALIEIKQWLLSLQPEFDDIPADYDLITNRVIDSLKFIELTERLQELTGRELDVETMEVPSFQTLAAIRQHYLACLDAA